MWKIYKEERSRVCGSMSEKSSYTRRIQEVFGTSGLATLQQLPWGSKPLT